MLAGGMLIALYLLRAFQNFAITWKENRKLASITSAYYLSIVFYTFSMVVVVVQPSWSEPAGGIGFGLLLMFIAGVLLFNELYFAGEKYSAFQFLKRYVDKSVLVLVIYLLFTLYLGLTKFKLIPQMYSSEYPQGYIQLVNKAESGEEKPQDGKYKHEKFKESLDRFLERNSTADD